MPKIGVVLGGGGLKGFAHIGVMRALDERGVEPVVWAGTSIGGLMAAARVGGIATDEMARRAIALRRRDLFRINHFGMLMERMRSPSIYLEEPLRELCRSVIPPKRFTDLPTRLLINTVDIEHGTQMVWGLPGLDDVWVQDAAYASCALPGYFPPGIVGGRVCIDGGVIDNLPASIVAALGVDAIIAVDVGSVDLSPMQDTASQGFASIYMRAATAMMAALKQHPLNHWDGPPMILVRPKVGDGGWMSFTEAEKNIARGYEATKAALVHLDECVEASGGIYPKRRVDVRVDPERCIGCGLCVSLAPRLMGLDTKTGKAFARTRSTEWSPADGGFVYQCPTRAIVAQSIDQDAAAAAQARPAEATPAGAGA